MKVNTIAIMTKRTFSILAILIAILIIGYLAFDVHNKKEYPVIQTGDIIEFSLEGMRFSIPDTSLSAIVHKESTPDSSERFFASFTDPDDLKVLGTISVTSNEVTYIAGDKSKVLVPIVVNFGGSGQFVYIAYLSRTAGMYQHVNSVLVGDRIIIDEFVVIPISSNTAGPEAVVLKYKERTSEQSFVDEPTLSSEIFLHVRDNALREEKRIINGQFEEVQIDNLFAYADVQNKFVLQGELPGTWYFEASFPIVVEDMEGQVLYQTFATAKEDWMTTDKVPFESLVILPKDLKGLFKLVIKNDNPSALPENDKRFEIYLNAI